MPGSGCSSYRASAVVHRATIVSPTISCPMACLCITEVSHGAPHGTTAVQQEKAKPCDPNPCKNQGVCKQNGDRYYCGEEAFLVQ